MRIVLLCFSASVGHISEPGRYLLSANLTVEQAIAKAGGAKPSGNEKAPEIRRIVDGKRVLVIAKPTDLVLPDDSIVIPARKQ